MGKFIVSAKNKIQRTCRRQVADPLVTHSILYHGTFIRLVAQTPTMLQNAGALRPTTTKMHRVVMKWTQLDGLMRDNCLGMLKILGTSLPASLQEVVRLAMPHPLGIKAVIIVFRP